MEADKTHINEIRKQFSDLGSKHDLLDLLNQARRLHMGEGVQLISMKSLNYHANPDLNSSRYRSFPIKKKMGGARTIHAPNGGLKAILRSVNLLLQCLHEPHKASFGFIEGKSIVDNAKHHVNKHYVYNLDLEDFFHSFDRNRVKLALMYEPFGLNDKKEPLAFLLASLCTHPFEVNGEQKTVLPQGSPTSPILTDILCRKLDRRLNGLGKRFGAVYTRYADDITFSSVHNIYEQNDFQAELTRIIEEDQRLSINQRKTRLQKSDHRQETTGLIINNSVNVRRRYVKQLRMWLHYWEKYGYEKAEQIFKRDYLADKGHVKNMDSLLINVIGGKLEFLKMVKGDNDSTYMKLKKRYESLSGFEDPLNQILGLWERAGVEAAMELYYGKTMESL